MHLHISIALLFSLLTGGFCLECYKCYKDCQEKMTCDSEKSRCVSTKGAAYMAGRKVSDVSTGPSCVEPRECKSWSITTLYFRQEETIHCCDTDLCNGAQPDLKWNPQPNGKECFSCDWEGCSQIVKCRGNEDRCFTAYEDPQSAVVHKGCASNLVCESPRKLLGSGVNVTCCEGNMCNAAQSDP